MERRVGLSGDWQIYSRTPPQPNINECIKDLDHASIQILTGHGAFGTYLHRFTVRETEDCPDCGLRDHPHHAILECPAQEDLRTRLEEEVDHQGIPRPWNFSSLLRNETLRKTIFGLWKTALARRNI